MNQDENQVPPAMPVQPQEPVPFAPPKSCGMATASLVCGILSMTCCGFFTGIPAIILGHKAKTKIKQSQNSLSGEGLALAGLILGYVNLALSIILIPIYLAIAIPAFVKARDNSEKFSCINNLRMIDSAKEQWAMANNKNETAEPTWNDLVGANGYLKVSPVCRKQGTYTIGKINERPTCSVPKHSL